MNQHTAIELLANAIRATQTVQGSVGVPLDSGIRPLSDIDGFDSLLVLEVEAMLESQLGEKVEGLGFLGEDSEPRTLGEIATSLARCVSGR